MTLTGEGDWGCQHHAAETLVIRMRGVISLANQITIRADEVAADVGAQISAALARRAQREFAGTAIDARDGAVTLTGTVSSLAEKRAACGTAWSAKGASTQVFHRHSALQRRRPTLRKVCTSVPQQRFNYR